jgi:capsular polysaccharide biosynthesis protein
LFQPPSNSRIYISRSRYNEEYKRQAERGLNLERARLRYFADEQAVEDLFVANDYKVVHAQDYGLYEQVREFSQASHVASISGAGLLNLMWCDAHTTGIEICAVPRYKWHFDIFAQYANVSNYKKVDTIGYDIQMTLKTISSALQDI